MTSKKKGKEINIFKSLARSGQRFYHKIRRTRNKSGVA
jgi:hypothetical protein